MIDKSFFKTLKEKYSAFAQGRREVIALAGDAQHASKRAIFALHRDDTDNAAALLADAAAKLSQVRAMFVKRPELAHEGSFRAAMEEFAEAKLYEQFVATGNVGEIPGAEIDYDTYLGGLSDLTGELARRQVRFATAGDADEAKRLKEEIEAIVAELLEMDLSGYLRTKFDQAKNNLRRAEDIVYELSLRRS
jgi:predicted translin family RNA/ssDNA-binding protein